MEKTLDLSKTVYELATTIPEFLEVTDSLGLQHLRECIATKPGPKVITLPQLAANHEMALDTFTKAFEARGFKVVNG